VPGFSPGSPRALDRGDIATGGGADGEGELVPPPLSPTLQIPYFPGIPHPTRAFGRRYPYPSAGIPPPLSPTLQIPYFPGIPHPTRAFGRRYPYPSAGIPHPTRAFGRRYPYPSAGIPHPARAFVGIPIRFCRHPPPRPRLRQGILIRFCRHPHPTRAFGAPPPPPPGGGVRAWRYQVRSRVRGAAGGPPCPVSLQDLPMCWTVGISPRGVGLTGRGNSFPLPCLPRSKYLTSPAPPPHPRLRRSSPAPSRGRGQCVAISGGKPYPALLQDLPVHWTVGISPRGVGLTGRGNSFPLPCLPRSKYLTSPAPPPHPRLRRSSPAPIGGVGSAWRYLVGSRIRGVTGGQPCPGCSRRAAVSGA